MEELWTVLSGSDIGIVGLLLVVIAGLARVHFAGYIKRLEKVEQYTEAHDKQHIELEKDCRERHEYSGVDRRKPKEG